MTINYIQDNNFKEIYTNQQIYLFCSNCDSNIAFVPNCISKDAFELINQS